MGLFREAVDQAMVKEFEKMGRKERRAFMKPQNLKNMRNLERQFESAGQKKELKEIRKAIRLYEAVKAGEL